MRRRDSKSLLHADDDGQGRRGSTGEPFQRRPSAADMHVRHSSAGLGDSQRRGSVDSDGDLLDEVSEIGAPWEPAFDRRPQGVDALDWMMVRLRTGSEPFFSPFCLSFNVLHSPIGSQYVRKGFLLFPCI